MPSITENVPEVNEDLSLTATAADAEQVDQPLPATEFSTQTSPQDLEAKAEDAALREFEEYLMGLLSRVVQCPCCLFTSEERCLSALWIGAAFSGSLMSG